MKFYNSKHMALILTAMIPFSLYCMEKNDWLNNSRYFLSSETSEKQSDLSKLDSLSQSQLLATELTKSQSLDQDEAYDYFKEICAHFPYKFNSLKASIQKFNSLKKAKQPKKINNIEKKIVTQEEEINSIEKALIQDLSSSIEFIKTRDIEVQNRQSSKRMTKLNDIKKALEEKDYRNNNLNQQITNWKYLTLSSCTWTTKNIEKIKSGNTTDLEKSYFLELLGQNSNSSQTFEPNDNANHSLSSEQVTKETLKWPSEPKEQLTYLKEKKWNIQTKTYILQLLWWKSYSVWQENRSAQNLQNIKLFNNALEEIDEKVPALTHNPGQKEAIPIFTYSLVKMPKDIASELKTLLWESLSRKQKKAYKNRIAIENRLSEEDKTLRKFKNNILDNSFSQEDKIRLLNEYKDTIDTHRKSLIEYHSILATYEDQLKEKILNDIKLNEKTFLDLSNKDVDIEKKRLSNEITTNIIEEDVVPIDTLELYLESQISEGPNSSLTAEDQKKLQDHVNNKKIRLMEQKKEQEDLKQQKIARQSNKAINILINDNTTPIHTLKLYLTVKQSSLTPEDQKKLQDHINNRELQRDQERLAQERLAQERLEQQRVEQQRVEQQRVEQQRVEQQRVEQQRVEQQRVEQQRIEQEKLGQKRVGNNVSNNIENLTKIKIFNNMSTQDIDSYFLDLLILSLYMNLTTSEIDPEIINTLNKSQFFGEASQNFLANKFADKLDKEEFKSLWGNVKKFLINPAMEGDHEQRVNFNLISLINYLGKKKYGDYYLMSDQRIDMYILIAQYLSENLNANNIEQIDSKLIQQLNDSPFFTYDLNKPDGPRKVITDKKTTDQATIKKFETSWATVKTLLEEAVSNQSSKLLLTTTKQDQPQSGQSKITSPTGSDKLINQPPIKEEKKIVNQSETELPEQKIKQKTENTKKQDSNRINHPEQPEPKKPNPGFFSSIGNFIGSVLQGIVNVFKSLFSWWPF